MTLNLSCIEATRPTGRTQRLYDGEGLYLEVSPRGGRWWRFKYRFGGREKRLSLGVYPLVGLEDARRRKARARALLAQGQDPAIVRRSHRQQLAAEAAARSQELDHGQPDAAIVGLRCFNLFSDLSDEELAAFGRHCVWKNYAARQSVLHSGAKEGVILVLSGTVAVSSIEANGREVTFVQLQSGFLFGEIFVLLDQPVQLSAVAVTPSVVATVDRRDFLELLNRHPSIQHRLLHRLAFIVEKLAQRIIELSTLPVSARVCAELLRAGHAQDESTTDNGERPIRLMPALTQQNLADAIGASREQVARVMSELAREGMVIRQGRALQLADLPGLRRRVQVHGGDAATGLESISYARLLASISTMRDDPLAGEN